MTAALRFAAGAEAATGLALLVAPSLVARLLLGEDTTGIAVPIARVTGIALIGLGVACGSGTPRLGMLIYSAGVAVVLGYAGLVGSASGALLWPAVLAHAVLTALLARSSGSDASAR